MDFLKDSEPVLALTIGDDARAYPVQVLIWHEVVNDTVDGIPVTVRRSGTTSPLRRSSVTSPARNSTSCGTNPYPGYDDVTSSPFLFTGEVDGRLAAKERVLGIERDGDAAAVRLDVLPDREMVELEVGGQQLVAWVLDGTASALDAGTVSEGRDVGVTGVFSPEIDGAELTFTAQGEEFVDDETGSTWNVLGEATSGTLAGRRLEAIPHVDTFWFAWSAFRPESSIVG